MSIPRYRPPVALTIAGFDPSSGAGVTADLQVFAAHGLYGSAAITALTVQSTRGVAAVEPVQTKLLRETLDELQADLPPAGIKIGMLGSAAVVHTVADFLRRMGKPGAPGRNVPVVLDPVLHSSSGAGLLDAGGLAALGSELLPLVDWITPNWQELAWMSGMDVRREDEAGEATERLAGRFPGLGIVVTGGDLTEPVDLLRTRGGSVERLRGTHVETTSTHGTGCAFSSALLCGLVTHQNAFEAAQAAKRYVEGALRRAPGLGSGRGPMRLLWPLESGPDSTQLP